MMKDNITISVV